MFCSTIIPTVGRIELTRAVESVLAQYFPADDFQVIVVNDSGKPLADAPWMHSAHVRVLETDRRERSVARNTGAALAHGRYLHFLDDDDWLLPGALHALAAATVANPNAAWLYGGASLVDRQGQHIIDLDPGIEGNCFTQTMAGEWVPLQVSLIRADAFWSVGGFSPLIPGVEDMDLARRIALLHSFGRTDTVVGAIGMGTERSTTRYERSLQDARMARELILDEAGAYTRLNQSAVGATWRGRMTHIYLVSFVHNLRQSRFTRALSRLGYALLSVLGSGTAPLWTKYWQALLSRYESDAFLRGFAEAGRPIEKRSAALPNTLPQT